MNLGNPFGTDEAACFDVCDSGRDETVDEGGFEVDGDDTALFVLEAVAGCDFDDVDGVGGGCCEGSGGCSSCSEERL